MEAAAESVAAHPARVPLPDLPSISEEELSRSVVGNFAAALRAHRERADLEMARGAGEGAAFAARELLVNGVLGEREGVERPLALLGSLFRILGCSVSAWRESPCEGLLRVADCPVRRALSLTGMDCPGPCERLREGALSVLEAPASSARVPGGPGCALRVRLGEDGR